MTGRHVFRWIRTYIKRWDLNLQSSTNNLYLSLSLFFKNNHTNDEWTWCSLRNTDKRHLPWKTIWKLERRADENSGTWANSNLKCHWDHGVLFAAKRKIPYYQDVVGIMAECRTWSTCTTTATSLNGVVGKPVAVHTALEQIGQNWRVLYFSSASILESFY